MVPPSSRHTKRPPITIEALCILQYHLDPQSPFNVAVAAVASMAFWCCYRLGELTIRDHNFFDSLNPKLQDNKTDPLTALLRHEIINNNIPTYAPLFSYKTPSGWGPLTKISFISHCNNVWVQNSFPSINPDIIAVQGQWTSQAFLDYWRRVESILPLFISSSINIDCLQNVDASMTAFIRHHNVPQA
ncbi:hypothetical protein PAXRUDRAFT_22324 [Paxillus rubicundulus Ve08.2h10]|uniref:Unplaced genomic scaffold scaffold_6341, whole genome shotgun sequence n=1 Tax=Paxillus rubicundulus Ve08.2h10 TaxID=930991 RepID=A0A0D0D5K6_9AGAM|nr:hypothetical protein PAXRUDRAFT_22324 [Paxillus rubicundulus Ve08.2h10]